MTNLQKRVLVSAIYFPLLLLSARFSSSFVWAMAVCLGLSWHEYLLFRKMPSSLRDWINHSLKLFFGILPLAFLLSGLSVTHSLVLIGFVVQLVVIASLFQEKQLSEVYKDSQFLSIGFLYLTGLFTSMVLLHSLPNGTQAIWFLFFVVAAADTGAYFVGRWIGRTPFFPRLSPKKTREGFYGGILSAVVVALALYYLFDYVDFQMPALPVTLSLGLIVAVFSAFGDLFESLLKRQHGVKDSGTLLPGHGGVLDRLDAVIFGSLPLLLYSLFMDGFR